MRIAEIRAQSTKGGDDLFRTVSQSIAPEIFGHEDVKKVCCIWKDRPRMPQHIGSHCTHSPHDVCISVV